MPGQASVVVGVDLEPGSSPSSSREPLYAVVVLRDGEVYAQHEGVPLRRLVRLIWEHRPGTLAIDNIYELGEDEAAVARFASLLPPDVEIVQVTRLGGEFVDVREAARRAGIQASYGKPGPLATALLAARLAHLGYGSRVRIVEEKTRILVARGRRSPSPGGTSQQRYNRRIRGSLLRISREIKKRLDEHGFDYDMIFRRSEGGIERAVFIVYAPRSKLEGIVKPHKGHDVRVEITPIYSSRITFEDAEEPAPPKPVIVGIDPGVTVGLAILDLAGRPLLLHSGKDLDRGEIISIVKKHGSPVVVATDVADVPDTVKKLAASLGVPVYSPPQDLPTLEKQEILQQYSRTYGVEARDTHARDALAAAVKAYRSLEQKLRQAEAYASRIGLDISLDAVKAAVARGRSIAEAVEAEIDRIMRQSQVGEERPVRVEAEKPPTSDERVRRLEEEILDLKKERNRLRQKIRTLEWTVEELERRLREKTLEFSIEVARDREVEMLQREVQTLTSRIRRLEEEVEELRSKAGRLVDALASLYRGAALQVRVVEKLTMTGLRESERLYGPLRRGEVVYVRNPNVYELEAVARLREAGVAGVLMDRSEGGGLVSVLRRSIVPVAVLSDYLVLAEEGVVLVEPRVLEDLERLREDLRRRVERRIDLSRIVEEYRRKRLTELRES